MTFAASLPAAALLETMLKDSAWVTTARADTGVLVACLLDLVNALACVGTAVALYPVVRRVSSTGAIGFVASRSFEAAVIVVGVVCLLGVVTMRREPALHSGAEATTVAGALVAVRNWTFLIGPGLMAPINAALLAGSLRRSGLVPRWIPTVGLVGAPLLMASTVLTYFRGNETIVPVAALAVVPIFVWELSLGLRLTFRGPSLRSAP